jgi:hypothetical protein
VGDAPARPASPNFGMHTAAYNAGVKYGIVSKDHPEAEAPLLAGVTLEYQTVGFSGVTPNPAPNAETVQDYRLLTLAAVADYAVSGLSRFDAKLGLTQYKPTGSSARSKPDITGELGYTRGLSVVTEINARLFRRIVAAATTGSATTDTGIGIGVDWAPILDLRVLASYSWANSSYEGASEVAPENQGRSDQLQNATLGVGYALWRYYRVRVFGTYSDRDSSVSANSYNDVTGGLELSFAWK